MAEHTALTRDIAKRAALVERTPSGDVFGIAVALKMLAPKCRYLPALIATSYGFVEQRLAGVGDEVAPAVAFRYYVGGASGASRPQPVTRPRGTARGCA
jgi:hypothetical protein